MVAHKKKDISGCALHRRAQEIAKSKSNNPTTVNVHRPSYFHLFYFMFSSVAAEVVQDGKQ